MAELYHYECTDCDFEIWSTPWGGDIYGMGHGYYLYLCQDCSSLIEIAHEFTESAQKDINERKKKMSQFKRIGIESASHNFDEKCSKCGSLKIMRWTPEDGVCPACAGDVIRLCDSVIHTD